MRIEYHRTLLADRARNQAFYEALKRVIVPGQSAVADIGCGTGLLGFMAAKLGAKRVFLLEAGEIVSVARKLAKHNKLKNIEIVPAHSTDVTPPEKVDIVVSETLGNYALEENIIDTLADARARYLKPGGQILPRAITQHVAPVISSRFHDELTIWDKVGFDLNFEPARTVGLNNIYVRKLEARDLLASGTTAVQWDAIDLTAPTKTTRQGEARFSVKDAATVSGLAIWWRAELLTGIELSTDPRDLPTHWEQLFLPLLEPITVAPGETIVANLKSKSAYATGTDVKWTVSILARGGKMRTTQTMDLAKGYIA
jgi:type I protein arginine methyltransferase